MRMLGKTPHAPPLRAATGDDAAALLQEKVGAVSARIDGRPDSAGIATQEGLEKHVEDPDFFWCRGQAEVLVDGDRQSLA